MGTGPGVPNPDKAWQHCCNQTTLISPSRRYKLLHYKFLHRIYFTPVRQARTDPSRPHQCLKCRAEHAGFIHLAWTCPPVASYSIEVMNVLSKMLNIEIHPRVELALMGYVKDFLPPHRKFLALTRLLAKRRVTIHWGKGPSLKTMQWLQDMAYCKETLDAYWECMPPSHFQT